VKQLLDERGERVGAYRVFSRGDDVLPVRSPTSPTCSCLAACCGCSHPAPLPSVLQVQIRS